MHKLGFLTLAGALLASTAVSTPALAQPQRLAFEPVQAPVTDAEKRAVLASPSVVIDGQEYKIGYHVLARSGDVMGDNTFGLLIDQNGNPIVNADGSQHVSSDNDFSSLLQVDGKLFNVTHFESRPGAMYLSEVNQDLTSGALSFVSTKPIDFSAFGGLWVPCAGTVTPWGTHLGSEEYEPDARAIEAAQTLADIEDWWKPFTRYFGVDAFAPETSVEDFRAVFEPYRYGYPVEVTVDGSGDATVEKRFAMARVAIELAYVMPDRRTVYISDDGTNVALYMFVADHADDLSAGTLYAAKWHQTSDVGGGAADITWVDLGHAEQDVIANGIAADVQFSDLFDTAEPQADGSCADSDFTAIHSAPGGNECLRVKGGMKTLASRLETRRYAAMQGATTEFRKMEGFTFDPVTGQAFLAMSEVARGMEDGHKNDKGGSNDIRLSKNKCGTVYALDVGADAEIGSDYVVKSMTSLVEGMPHDYAENSPFAGNTCAIDGIANPDNVTVMPGYDTLIIGEDTGSGHQNDAVWAFDLNTKTLTRILTTPYGSETTSPYFYGNINGYGYLMGVIQHPYGESDQDKAMGDEDLRAYVGYVGPFPWMAR